MQLLRAAIIAALLLFETPGSLHAQDVTLTSTDGTVEVSGALLGYDGELYRIESEFGVLTLDGSQVSCAGPGCPDLTGFVSEFRISGSRTMGEILMPALVETFAARRGTGIERRLIDDTHFEYVLTDRETEKEIAKIGFRVTSTSEGFADLVADEADIVLSTREVTRSEIRLGIEAGIGNLDLPRRSRIIGLDALVPIVARSNPVSGILFEDISKVFAGEISDWSELGGDPAAIRLHLRDDLSGLAEEFERRVMNPADRVLANTIVLHPDNASLADAVARDASAIGIAAFSDIGNARPLNINGVCGKRSSASVAGLKTEDYPLTTPLFIYSPAGRPKPLVREFMAYIRSAAAQPVIARSGFVDLRVSEVPLDAQGLRLANAINAAGSEIKLSDLKRLTGALDGSARLTLSFRFETGGTRLDAQSRSNIETLATELESGRFDQRTIMFIGFSDGVGPAAGNLRLARRRAETVRKAVLRAAPAADRDRLDIQVDAFGEAMPMACDDSDWGRGINRRVEVWVK